MFLTCLAYLFSVATLRCNWSTDERISAMTGVRDLWVTKRVMWCVGIVSNILLQTCTNTHESFPLHWLGSLARSANLPTGLCILLALISSFFSFFTMSKAISVSTGPIFTIFLPNGRYLREFSWSGPFFTIPQGTLPWQPILCRKQNANHVRFLQFLHQVKAFWV